MASRYFFALCALALIAAVAAAPVEEVDVDDVELEEDSERIFPEIALWAAGEGVAYLNKHFIKVKAKCFPEVFENCDINIVMHPKKYYKCAKNYFESHADRCMKKEIN